MDTVRHATVQAAAERGYGHAPGSARAAALPPRKPCPTLAGREGAGRRTEAPPPRASSCGGLPCRGDRRGAAPEEPTSAAAAAAGGRGHGTAAGEEGAVGGDRRERGGAGEAEAGKRGSGARCRRGRGRCRSRLGSAMDDP